MNPGEIYLAKFPFGDSPGMKLRPVLLLTGPLGPVPEILVAYISSVLPNQTLPSDLILDPAKPEFASTHLKKVSALRLHKLATIHCASLVRRLGKLDPAVIELALNKLSDMLLRGEDRGFYETDSRN